MFKGILSVVLFMVVLLESSLVLSQEVSSTTGEISKSQQNQDTDPTAMTTKVKSFFSKNEQKNKVMRSKDIVRYKERIREQEMLRIQKEREIKYLERRLNEKQKTLDRLKRSKGE